MSRHKIIYWDKEVKRLDHFFEVLPQLQFLEKYHHLISPFEYTETQIKLKNMRMKQ